MLYSVHCFIFFLFHIGVDVKIHEYTCMHIHSMHIQYNMFILNFCFFICLFNTAYTFIQYLNNHCIHIVYMHIVYIYTYIYIYLCVYVYTVYSVYIQYMYIFTIYINACIYKYIQVCIFNIYRYLRLYMHLFCPINIEIETNKPRNAYN